MLTKKDAFDWNGEFTSNEFKRFCDDSGITRHLTAPYSPQQNGVVERRNKTLLEMTRSILKHMNVPNYLWGEAIRHATYIINRVSTRVLKSQMPYEALKGRKPNVDHMRVFGCLAYAKVDSHLLRKLDDRTRILVHLGTEPGSKAYRLFDPNTRKLVVSRDVVFDEEKGWTWSNMSSEVSTDPGMFKIVFGTHGNNRLYEEEENNHGKENHEEEEEINEEQNSNEEQSGSVFPISTETEQPQEEVRRSTRIRKLPKHVRTIIYS